MSGYDDEFGDFDSDDPYERYQAHQAAKGRTATPTVPPPDDAWTDIQWCQSHYRLMSEGGIWGVPRSGLVFKKWAGGLYLYEVMPYDPDMPLTKEQFIEQQVNDYYLIKDRFDRAEIPTTFWPGEEFWQ